MYGEIERQKVQFAIRGNKMRPEIDFGEARKTYCIPAQAGLKLVLLAGVAKNHGLGLVH